MHVKPFGCSCFVLSFVKQSSQFQLRKSTQDSYPNTPRVSSDFLKSLKQLSSLISFPMRKSKMWWGTAGSEGKRWLCGGEKSQCVFNFLSVTQKLQSSEVFANRFHTPSKDDIQVDELSLTGSSAIHDTIKHLRVLSGRMQQNPHT